MSLRCNCCHREEAAALLEAAFDGVVPGRPPLPGPAAVPGRRAGAPDAPEPFAGEPLDPVPRALA